MKRITTITLAALALLVSLPAARAWTYRSGDALLIFHKTGKNDVEFDLGNVNQFTNLASGTTITVSGWSLSLVTNTFGTDLTGVSVVLAATTVITNASPASWITRRASSYPSEVPYQLAYQVGPSLWQLSYWSIIDSIGTRPVIYQAATSGANGYSIDPNGSAKLTSYDRIVTGENHFSLTGQGGFVNNNIAQLGGHAAFNVEGVVPASIEFWQIKPTTTVPAPPAKYLGTFNITAAGVLTYTAGLPTPIPSISRTAGINTVSFPTVFGATYSLTYSNALNGSSTNWPVVAGPLTGDGISDSLSHTPAGSVGFYGVKATP